MPVGLVTMRWDDRVGTQLLGKYPEEINISEKTLMQVYSTHEYSREAGMISMMVGPLNIASYYTGPEKSFYLLLLLSLDDDPDLYEGGMADCMRMIIQAYEEGALEKVIPTVFQQLSIFPTLTEEQLLAITYQDEIKRIIINRLREESVVSKSELVVWLRDKYEYGLVDIDAVLIELIKREIIKEASVKGMPSELIFLTGDIIALRKPPSQLVKNPAEKGLPERLAEDYVTAVKKYFQKYRPSEEDTLKIMSVLINPQAYITIKLLRTAIVTKSELEKLKKKGVDNVDETLKMLWENQLIQVFQDEKKVEYYALLSDFNISTMFPKYLLNIIKKQYEVKSKSNQVLIECINVLEDVYLLSRTKSKAEKTE